MLFFTVYLYKKAKAKSRIELSSFGKINDEEADKYESYFINLLKSDHNSQYHLNMIHNLLKTSFELLN